MSDIEIAATDAAADVLAMMREETLARAQDAARSAALRAGADPMTAIAVSLRVVAEMTEMTLL